MLPLPLFAASAEFLGQKKKDLIREVVFLGLLACAACGLGTEETVSQDVPLYLGETAALRVLINHTVDAEGVPHSLVHRVIQRESDYRPDARNGPYYGLMQILPETAGQMGFRGQLNDLLDAQTNLTYATRYLRGAWLVADGDET